jgi:hypothetical protein
MHPVQRLSQISDGLYNQTALRPHNRIKIDSNPAHGRQPVQWLLTASLILLVTAHHVTYRTPISHIHTSQWAVTTESPQADSTAPPAPHTHTTHVRQ